ncbi:hypothetical protein CFP56_002686 [Quercus suber]|uniref:Uncharacterized protein n=1 Tax=Quercus suber TaxID=58331 RepID=A0AAW0LCY5_QUESU
MTNPYSQQLGVELVRNPTPITFSNYPPNTCHFETYPSADTMPSKPENLTRINPPSPTKYSSSPMSLSPPRTPSTTTTSTTTPSSKSDFVKLVGLLNPNVNKFAFSDEALNLVCKAWMMLSDSDKRAQYEDEIDKTAEAAFWTLCSYCYYMYKYEKMYEDCCLRCYNCRKRFHGVAVNSPRKMEKNGETEIGYFVCWTYFPLGERERKLGMSGNCVNLGGNVGDFLWIPDEKKDVKNNCVKGNTKAGRWMNVKTVGRKTKKVLGNNIGRNE